MLDYTQVLKELEHDSEEIAKFVRYLENLKFDVGDTDRYHAMNDMMTMIGLFQQYLKQLHVEATVCRQRKKTTPNFEKLYRRAVEYRDVVENNRTMYSLMFA